MHIKACNIVVSCNDSSDVSKVVVCLSGFHTLMFVVVLMGYTRIIQESCLRVDEYTVYAPNSVHKQMLTGQELSEVICWCHTGINIILVISINIYSAWVTSIGVKLNEFTEQPPSFKLNYSGI